MKVEIIRESDKKTWVTVLTGKTNLPFHLCAGSSANRAADARDAIQRVIDTSNGLSIRALVERNADKKWEVWLEAEAGERELIESFGSHANAASDFAQAINAIIK